MILSDDARIEAHRQSGEVIALLTPLAEAGNRFAMALVSKEGAEAMGQLVGRAIVKESRTLQEPEAHECLPKLVELGFLQLAMTFNHTIADVVHTIKEICKSPAGEASIGTSELVINFLLHLRGACKRR